ncbi:961_t:CDS:1, partial [Acaulospora colombiana]
RGVVMFLVFHLAKILGYLYDFEHGDAVAGSESRSGVASPTDTARVAAANPL